METDPTKKQRSVMFATNDITKDARIQKEAASLGSGGYEVVVFGLGERGRVEAVTTYSGFEVRCQRSNCDKDRRQGQPGGRGQPKSGCQVLWTRILLLNDRGPEADLGEDGTECGERRHHGQEAEFARCKQAREYNGRHDSDRLPHELTDYAPLQASKRLCSD